MPIHKFESTNFGKVEDLKHLVKRTGHELIYQCPYCAELVGKPDTKGKFYYNEMRGVGHCFVCESRITNTGLRSMELICQQIEQDKITDFQRYELQLFNIMGWTWKLSAQPSEQLDYMVQNRKIGESILDRFNVLGCDSPNRGVVFCNKIIPADGNLHTDFFQLRRIKELPKYVNLRDTIKPLSWTEYVETKSVMILEGFISALAAYQHLEGKLDPLVLEGKSISQVQIQQLKQMCREKAIEDVYVILDGGTNEEALRLAKKLERELADQTIFITKLPFKKDPNDLGRADFRTAFSRDTIPYTRLSESLVRQRLYSKRGSI